MSLLLFNLTTSCSTIPDTFFITSCKGNLKKDTSGWRKNCSFLFFILYMSKDLKFIFTDVWYLNHPSVSYLRYSGSTPFSQGLVKCLGFHEFLQTFLVWLFSLLNLEVPKLWSKYFIHALHEIFGTALKVNLSLWLTKHETMNVYFTVEVLLHSFLTRYPTLMSQASGTSSFASGQENLDTHWIRGWVCPRSGLDALPRGNGESLPTAGNSRSSSPKSSH